MALHYLFWIGTLATVALSDSPPVYVSPGINVTTSSSAVLNCTNIHQGFSPACYNVLNITSFLVNQNVSVLGELCSPSQPWSECFQIEAYANATSPSVSRVLQMHNCSILTTNSNNSLGCTMPNINEKNWTPGIFYGVWNIYSLQSHLSVWAQAVSDPASQSAVANVTGSNSTANSILISLVGRYNIDADADKALINLLKTAPTNATGGAPEAPPDPVQRVGHLSNIPTTAAWQDLLQGRLAEVLKMVMNNFNLFLVLVGNGAYSSPTLATAGQLINRMRA